MIAGGVESMSRAPFVMGKADAAFSRKAEIFDTTLGWRFINPAMKEKYGVDSMAETGENVAAEFKISRADQDLFALRSQYRWGRAQVNGFFHTELIPVPITQEGGTKMFDADEHPRPDTTLEALTKLKPVTKPDGTVTAGNASGINDGSAALLVASENAVKKYGLSPKARVVASATAGVAPRLLGMGPAPATRKALAKAGLKIEDIGVIELNEAFAAQGLAVLRDLGISPTTPTTSTRTAGRLRSGIRSEPAARALATTAVYQMAAIKARYALCTMCIGVGQGIATILERC